mmetsp:Transcript_3863/g.11987  ORF Transcript_3863/g.11987 Transcript_3863/m.11987 type:complete len:114 (-) Transcript_3863:1048-1389(-)
MIAGTTTMRGCEEGVVAGAVCVKWAVNDDKTKERRLEEFEEAAASKGRRRRSHWAYIIVATTDARGCHWSRERNLPPRAAGGGEGAAGGGAGAADEVVAVGAAGVVRGAAGVV